MFRWRVVYAALLLFGSVAAALWWSFDAAVVLEPLRAMAQAELSAALGSRVTVDRVSLGVQAVVLGKMLMHAGSADASRAPLVSVERAELHLDWWPVLGGGEPEVDGLVLEGVRVASPAPSKPGAQAPQPAHGPPSPGVWAGAVEHVLQSRIQWCRVSDLEVRARVGAADRDLRVENATLECQRAGETLELRLDAGQVAFGTHRARQVRVRASADPSALNVGAIELRTADVAARATATLRWAQTPARLALSGQLRMQGEALQRTLGRVLPSTPGGVALRADRAIAAIELNGPWGQPTDWEGRGRAVLREVAVDAPDGRPLMSLDTLYVEGAREGADLRLGSIEAHADGLHARARLALPQAGPGVLSATLELATLDPLRALWKEAPLLVRVDPRLGTAGSARVKLRARWTPERVAIDGELAAKHLEVRLAADHEIVALSRFGAHFGYRSDQPSRLDLDGLRIRGPRLSARGRARIGADAHHVRLRFERLDPRLLDGSLPGSIRRGVLRGTVALHGSPSAPLQRFSAHLEARDVLWRAPPAPSPSPHAAPTVSLVDLHGVAAHVVRARGVTRFEDVTVDGAAYVPAAAGGRGEWLDAVVHGRGELSPDRHHVELHVDELDGQALNLALPGTIERGKLSGSLVLDGTPGEPARTIGGEVALTGALWRPPAALGALPRVGIVLARADMRYDGGEWQVSHLRMDSTEGQILGDTRWHDGGHRTAVTVVPAPHGLVASMLPGRLGASGVRLTAEVRGTAAHPIDQARGQLQLGRGRWELPDDAGLCRRALQIRHASAHYGWNAGRLRVEDIDLETRTFRARGEASWTPGRTRVDLRVATRHADAVFDAFGPLSGLVDGGRGSAHVRIDASAEGTSGVVDGRIRDGVLAVASVSGAKRTRHPVDSARFSYEFGPGRHRIRDLRIRGPELNVDLQASWSDPGAVSGRGRLWLTRRYTEELARGAGWILHLLGYPRIDTRFTLGGTDQDVRMDATIAHGWRWRILRTAVPDRLERIGRGEAPLLAIEPTQQARCDS